MPNHEDLEKILSALYEWENAEPAEKPAKKAIYEDLLNGLLAERAITNPAIKETSEWMLKQAIKSRFKAYQRTRRLQEMATIPPTIRPLTW